jgi:hypothetical protein
MDFQTILAATILASFVLISLCMWMGGYRRAMLFRVPRNRVMRIFLYIVDAALGISAILWLVARTKLFGEPLMLWAMLLWQVYLWANAIFLIRGEARQPDLDQTSRLDGQ